MKDGHDPAAIVVSRRTLGWAGAALFALFSGGQVASLKLVGDDPQTPDPAVTALSARVDGLATTVDQLGADSQRRDAHFSKILNAVLIYFLEAERSAREQRPAGAPPRNEELERAAQRLRALAQDE